VRWVQAATEGVLAALFRGNRCNRCCGWVTSFSGVAVEAREGAHLGKIGQDVLTRLPVTPVGQFGGLLPDRWQAARQVTMAAPTAPATPITIPPVGPAY
jgi:hypothetical protein